MEQKFINEVLVALEEKTGKKWMTDIVKKNNGVVLTGVVINAKQEGIYSPVPIVHVDAFSGMSVDEAVEYVLYIYSNCPEISYNVKDFMIRNPEVRVVNKEKNKDFLKTAPYEDLVGDLALIFIEVVDNRHGLASIRITNDILKRANMPVEELSAIAKYNTLKHRLFSQNLVDIVRSMDVVNMFDEDDIIYYLLQYPEEVPMQVVSLDNQLINGSRILAFPELLDDIVEEDSYIIPSSIHECIIISKGSTKSEILKEIVYDVNRISVQDTDFLSDNVFEFIKDTKEIKVAS